MKSKRFCAAAMLCAAVFCAQAAQAFLPLPLAGFAAEAASADARFAAAWVAGLADNRSMPFAIVDKNNARMFVFEPGGRLRGATAVLLGAGAGDHSVPGMAQREPASLRPEERTTPAGRFVSEPGHNLKGEDIVWVDYDARIAIHRLRPDSSRERRAGRLASAAPDDNRVSYGCIVVPVSFYEEVVRPVLGRRHGIVYVLPETGTVETMFSALQPALNSD